MITHKPVHALFNIYIFLLPCGKITVGGEIPKLGITASKTTHITTLTVHLKIGLEIC